MKHQHHVRGIESLEPVISPQAQVILDDMSRPAFDASLTHVVDFLEHVCGDEETLCHVVKNSGACRNCFTDLIMKFFLEEPLNPKRVALKIFAALTISARGAAN